MFNLEEFISKYLQGESHICNNIALEHYRYTNDKYFCSIWRILDRPENDIIALNMIFSLSESFYKIFDHSDLKKYEWYRKHIFINAIDYKSISQFRNAVSHTTSPSDDLYIKIGLLDPKEPKRYTYNIENTFIRMKELYSNKIHSIVNDTCKERDKNIFLYNLLKFEND
ncbi:hypothetical protein RRM63_003746, partial [Photobacterium damselae]|nr:hypothetical protein [Photobacterium damselae]